MEAAMIGSGHGYTPATDSQPMTWNGDRQWQYREHWNALNVAGLSNTWNICAHLWLKYYIFVRWMDRDSKRSQLTPTVVTYIVSSVWHGIDPGFFVFFLFGGVLDVSARMIKASKLSEIPYELYYVPCLLLNRSVMSLLAIPFMFKEKSRFMPVLASFYYIPIWWPFLQLVVGILAPKKQRKPKTEESKKTN